MPHANLNFSVNNRFIGLDGSSNPNLIETTNANFNAAKAWLIFKDFMKNNGWTIKYSGVSIGPNHSYCLNQDILSTNNLMFFPSAHWVLQDPDGYRELLFYRSPIDNVKEIDLSPFNSDKISVYADPGRDLSHITLVSSTDGYVDEVTIDGYLIIKDLTGISEDMVGQYFYDGTNPYLITEFISDNEIKVQDDFLTHTLYETIASWQILPPGYMRGSKASISSSGTISQITGLVGITSKSIGQMIHITSTIGNNNGVFLITDVIDSSTVEAINPDMFVSADPDNGSLVWYECLQVAPLLGDDAGRMSIGYSARSGFNSVKTLVEEIDSVSCTTFVPQAIDTRWISEELSVDQYPGAGDGYDFMSAATITPATIWNMHCAGSTVAPFNFYILFSLTNSPLAWNAATKTNPNNSNIPDDSSIPMPYDTLSFICMDKISDYHASDNDPVVFWCDSRGGTPSISRGSYPRNVFSFNEMIGDVRIKAWYKKSSTYASLDDFATEINSYQSGFLPTSVMTYQVIEEIDGYEGGTMKAVTVVPGNMPQNIYDYNYELYPLMYGRNSVNYTYPFVYGTSPTQIKPACMLPASYKGTSAFMYLAGSTRNPFETLNVSEDRDYIYVGRFPAVVLPWNGSIPNLS